MAVEDHPRTAGETEQGYADGLLVHNEHVEPLQRTEGVEKRRRGRKHEREEQKKCKEEGAEYREDDGKGCFRM